MTQQLNRARRFDEDELSILINFRQRDFGGLRQACGQALGTPGERRSIAMRKILRNVAGVIEITDAVRRF